jgi:hypothetical protein
MKMPRKNCIAFSTTSTRSPEDGDCEICASEFRVLSVIEVLIPVTRHIRERSSSGQSRGISIGFG